VGKFAFDSFGANSDSIRKGRLMEWSDVFEWLWDLSEWEFTEVAHDWSLRELKEWGTG